MKYIGIHWTAHGDLWLMQTEAASHDLAARKLERNDGGVIVYAEKEIGWIFHPYIRRMLNRNGSLLVKKPDEIEKVEE